LGLLTLKTLLCWATCRLPTGKHYEYFNTFSKKVKEKLDARYLMLDTRKKKWILDRKASEQQSRISVTLRGDFGGKIREQGLTAEHTEPTEIFYRHERTQICTDFFKIWPESKLN